MARLQFTGHSSWVGKTLGLPLLLAGIALLVWNEYHQMRVTRLYDKAEASLTVLDDSTRVNPDYEGRLLYLNGWAHMGDTVADPLYGVGGRFLAVDRQLQYYHWVQHQQRDEYIDRDGQKRAEVSYYYQPEWVDKPVDSENFAGNAPEQYHNFALTEVTSHKTYSAGAHMASLELHHDLIDSVPATAPGSVYIDTHTPAFEAALDSTTHHGTVVCHLLGDTIYYGDDPYQAHVGDMRVIFSFYPECHAWVLAQQHGQQLRPYQDSDGYWFSFSRFSQEVFEPHDALAQDRWGQKMLRWTLRILGWLMIVWGIRQLFEWFVGLLRRIPILGPVFKMGLAAVAWVAGTLIALLTIGVSFLAVRPLLGIGIVATLVVVVVGGSWLYRRSHPVLPPPLPQQPMPQQPMPQQPMPQQPIPQQPMPQQGWHGSAPTPPPLP